MIDRDIKEDIEYCPACLEQYEIGEIEEVGELVYNDESDENIEVYECSICSYKKILGDLKSKPYLALDMRNMGGSVAYKRIFATTRKQAIKILAATGIDITYYCVISVDDIDNNMAWRIKWNTIDKDI